MLTISLLSRIAVFSPISRHIAADAYNLLIQCLTLHSLESISLIKQRISRKNKKKKKAENLIILPCVHMSTIHRRQYEDAYESEKICLISLC